MNDEPKVAKSGKPGPKPGGKRGGRRKGTPNKVTARAREALALFVEGNLPKMQGWLNRVARKRPDEALKIILHAAQFSVPMLARQEHTATIDRPYRMDHEQIDAITKLARGRGIEIVVPKADT